jgi:hypothetical protein
MKNLYLFILFSIFFSINTTLNGQSVKENYSKESIYLQVGFWSGQKYIKNGISHKIGLFNKDLKKEMKFSKDASFVYKKYVKNRNTGIILSVTSSALLAGGFIYSIKSFGSGSRNQHIILNTLVYTGLALSFVSLHFSLTANNNLHKAVWLRNRDLLEL